MIRQPEKGRWDSILDNFVWKFVREQIYSKAFVWKNLVW